LNGTKIASTHSLTNKNHAVNQVILTSHVFVYLQQHINIKTTVNTGI